MICCWWCESILGHPALQTHRNSTCVSSQFCCICCCCCTLTVKKCIRVEEKKALPESGAYLLTLWSQSRSRQSLPSNRLSGSDFLFSPVQLVVKLPPTKNFRQDKVCVCFYHSGVRFKLFCGKLWEWVIFMSCLVLLGFCFAARSWKGICHPHEVKHPSANASLLSQKTHANGEWSNVTTTDIENISWHSVLHIFAKAQVTSNKICTQFLTLFSVTVFQTLHKTHENTCQ